MMVGVWFGIIVRNGILAESLKLLAGKVPSRAKVGGERSPPTLHSPLVCGGVETVSGEIFVSMGLSGAGKLTLVRLCNRLIEPTSWRVLVDGRGQADADACAVPGRDCIDDRGRSVGWARWYCAASVGSTWGWQR
jgi:hypothetical protein